MSNKITTADCKKFLVEIIRSNPEIIHEIWGDTTTSMKEALDIKKWKREAKFNPNPEKGAEYAEDEYLVNKVHYKEGHFLPMLESLGYGSDEDSIIFEDLNCVRRFILDPEQLEGQVMFNVLEDKNGCLWLGDYVGD